MTHHRPLCGGCPGTTGFWENWNAADRSVLRPGNWDGGFEQRGFRLVGIFDIKPELIGRQLAGLPIQSMDALDAFCAAQQPAAAVLCLPKESAQTVAERLVSLGVRGLWNFSHCDLAVENAQVVTMHLDDSLMTLSYKLHNL